MAKEKIMETVVRFSIERAAREMNVSRETLRRGLMEIGEKTEKGQQFTLRKIYLALSGDAKSARARVWKADAELKELEVKVRNRELVLLTEVEKRIAEFALPIRQRFTSLAGEASAKCNPSDPEFARVALESWSADALRIVRDDFMKERSETEQRQHDA